MADLPGNPQHQALLQTILDYYAADGRIHAIIVFGSLGRGNWDDYSDIDLDIILADDCQFEPLSELEKLCRQFGPLGEQAVLIIPDDSDAGDVVLASLGQLSVRFHPLHTTKPAILDSMCILAGDLPLETIRAAALANPSSPEPPLEQLLHQVLRYAVGAGGYLQRGSYWLCVEVFHRMRNLLFELYRRTHDGQRTPQTFESQAGEALQIRLKATLPASDPQTLHQVLLHFLDILEADLAELSAGQVSLSGEQRALLARLRASLPG